MKNSVDISSKSIGLLTIAEFFFPDCLNNEDFVSKCSGMNGYQINEYLDSYRVSMISKTRFDSCSEFVNTYRDDEASALERLFQEKINRTKLETLRCKKPETIYELHVQDPTVPFNHFTGYFM